MIEPRCSHMTQSFIRWFNVYFCVYLLNGCYMPGSVLQARCKPGGNCCSCGTHILHALEQKQKQVTNQQVKCKEHKVCQMVIRTKKNNNKAEKKERECTVLKQREKIFLRRQHLNKDLKEEKEQVLHVSEGRTFQTESSTSAKYLPEVVVKVCSRRNRKTMRLQWSKKMGGHQGMVTERLAKSDESLENMARTLWFFSK